MHRLLGLLVLILAISTARPAPACMNEVLSTDDVVASLHRAEQALAEGDVETARSLSTEVADGDHGHFMTGDPLRERAIHIRALSFVRDPKATEEGLESAAGMLEARHRVGLMAPPPITVDWGETLERLGRHREAYEILAPLADKDLIGSAYAYAALSRAAKKQGDEERASTALTRCETMATRSGMCRGEYPSPPLLRGPPLAYAVPGIFFAVALVLRRLRGRSAPWRDFGAPFFAAAIVFAAAIAFALPRTPALGTIAAIAAIAALFVVPRRAFLSAARKGKVAGFIVRASEPADASIPTARLFFGPIAGETLERVDVDPAYRDSARRPVLRLERRSARGLAIVLVLLLVGLAFAGCSALFLVRSAKSAAAPALAP